MKLFAIIFFSAFSVLYHSHPTFATSDDEDGWSWGGDTDGTLESTAPKPTPTTLRPTEGFTTQPTKPTPPSGLHADCLKKCPQTPQYNPVCGTDNITYKNLGLLKCNKQCGGVVDLQHWGKCPAGPSTSTSKPTSLKPSSRVEACIRGCPKLPQYNPICGTDDVTYNNDALLACARNCGKSVHVKHRGKCPDNTSSEIPTSRPPTPKPTPPQVPSDLNEIIFKKCLNDCASTLDFQPICGSDGVTYANKALFNCQLKCGKNIAVSGRGKCPGIVGSTLVLNAGPDACLKKCPSLPQYNPICGSNNKTYRNEGLLKCAQRCGVDVKMSSLGSCPRP